ncbi:MAG: DUF4159 domain-containing protein [Gammaproteobacteria bacterium]|nr:DUF4159 domain-containing protein [Gammaproteobacteria bacterium]
MRRFALASIAVLSVTAAMQGQAQMPFREYLPFEGYDAAASLPPDHDVPGELVVGRLMYPGGGYGWLRGGTSWTVDYPKGDRTLAALLRRFTRIDVRSVEQPVNLDDGDDVYYWPFLIVGLAGNWQLTDSQVAKLREYLLRGGFLFSDSFFGSYDWLGFQAGLKRVFPDRPIIDLPADHPIFHIVYDVSELTHTQIPHMGSLFRGGYLSDGRVPHWRGIEDDDGRLMVLIAHNNDVSDSWQWADDPRYPADKANLGLRIGVNISAYMLTH